MYLIESVQDYPLCSHDRPHNIFRTEMEKTNVFQESSPDRATL